MTLLFDTHFLLWTALESSRLREFPWLDAHRPWAVSPVSLLEVQFLAEVGRLKVKNPAFTERVMSDPRFVVDEVPLVALIQHAIHVDWTRDPFDRLLAAHSQARRLPLCTVDGNILDHHGLVPVELAR